MTDEQHPRQRRGLALVTPERRREIARLGRAKGHGFERMSKERHHEVASMGARTLQETGRAYRWTSEQAALAGRKGGLISGAIRKRKKEAS